MITLRRTLTAAAVLVLTLPTAAHAVVSDHVVRASTSTLTISLFEEAVGAPLLEAGGTSATAQQGPTAAGTVVPVKVAGEAVLGETAAAESTGEAVTSPEDGGDGCLLAPDVSGLLLDTICATASADASDTLLDQSSSAALTVADVGVNGTLLADALSGGIDDALQAVADELQDSAVGAVVTALTDGCDTALGQIDDSEIPDTVNELLDMAPEEVEPIADELKVEAPDCISLLDADLENLLSPVLDITPILEALAGRDLLTLTFNDVSSTVGEGENGLTGDATQALVGVSGPSLDFLNDLLVGVVTAAFDSTAERIAAELGQEVPEELDLPAQLEAGLDQLPVFGEGEPLVTAFVDGGLASAAIDENGAATAGGRAPAVSVEFSPALMELFGQEPGPIEIGGGQTQPIAEGTPLESSISVGDLVTDEDAVDPDSELPGATARASATTVDLLSTVQGGVVISLAQSDAGAFGIAVQPRTETPDTPAPAEDLPRTGGGAVLGAALALGGAAALRRRRDG